MAVNIFGGRPNAALATTTQTFASMGLDDTNIYAIYEVGTTLKSWIPGRMINPIVGQIAGNGYYIVAKVDMDLTAYMAPPVSGIPAEIDVVLSATLQQVLDNGNISSTGMKIQVIDAFVQIVYNVLTFDDGDGATALYTNGIINFTAADGSFTILSNLGFATTDALGNPIVSLFSIFGVPTLQLKDPGSEFNLSIISDTLAANAAVKGPKVSGSLIVATRAKTTASVSSSTTQVISHGADVPGWTPTVISLTPGNALAANAHGYISAISSTTFTITFAAGAQTGSMVWHWVALP